eukprot:COSAG01_NODE_3413_length_6125_cov_26.475938_4_plen_337_part_00
MYGAARATTAPRPALARQHGGGSKPSGPRLSTVKAVPPTTNAAARGVQSAPPRADLMKQKARPPAQQLSTAAAFAKPVDSDPESEPGSADQRGVFGDGAGPRRRAGVRPAGRKAPSAAEVGAFRARAMVAQLTAHNLGRRLFSDPVLGSEGRRLFSKEGRRLFEALLPPMDAALGTTHAAAMTARNNYAATLAQLGDREGANAQMRRVIAASTQARGVSHPDTLTMRRNLAVGLAATGETEAAGREYEAVLAGRTVQLGADHRDTLWSKLELAYHHKRNLGDAAKGVAMLREVVAACERNPELGREYRHPSRRRSFAAELAAWECELSPLWRLLND